MIKIEFGEPDTRKWERWRRDCERATAELTAAVAAGNAPEISDLYRRKSIKDEVYMARNGPFRGKCAYCECLIAGFQHGDMEHFRPKKGVTDADDALIRRAPSAPVAADTSTTSTSESTDEGNGDAAGEGAAAGEGVAASEGAAASEGVAAGEGEGAAVDDGAGADEVHPGYYWLAYHWRNLLPSCVDCNQASTVDDPVTGRSRKLGKHNRFPVAPGTAHAWSPDEVSGEQPLLINPIEEDPGEHLAVDVRTGQMVAKTPRGRVCVDVFGLNLRERLPEERRKVMDQVKLLFVSLVTVGDAEARAALERIFAGEGSYTLAARTMRDEMRRRLRALID